MVQMVSRDILPAVTNYLGELSDTVLHLDKCRITNNSLLDTANRLSQLLDMAHQRNDKLQQLIDEASKLGKDLNAGLFYRDNVVPAMQELREVCDKLESITAARCWPFPTYGDLLFSV